MYFILQVFNLLCIVLTQTVDLFLTLLYTVAT